MANPTGKGGFQRGDDPKRNKHGQRNKAAVSFSRSIRDLIVKHGEKKRKAFDKEGNLIRTQKNIEWVVEAIYKEAISGNMVAVNFIAERVEGKITDKVEVTGANGAGVVIDLVAIDYRKGMDALKPEDG